MTLKEFFDLAWHILVVDGWSVAWRVGLLSIVSAGPAVALLFLCYRLLYRKERLKLNLRREHLFEKAVLALWIVGIPTLTVTIGALLGTWWAGQHLIKSEHLGERIGKSAFQVVAAGIASANLETSESDRVKLAGALMRGEQKLSLTQVSRFTSHHAGELSAAQLQALLPMASEQFQHGTAWAVEKTLDVMALYQLGDGGDVLYKMVAKVTEHDRLTDNDGYVTVQEIADVACESFLDRSTSKLWAALILHFLLPVLGLLLLFPVTPLLGAWLTRKVVAWRAARA